MLHCVTPSQGAFARHLCGLHATVWFHSCSLLRQCAALPTSSIPQSQLALAFESLLHLS